MENYEIVGTLYAFDLNSTFLFGTKVYEDSLDDFEVVILEFEKCVPFKKYYLDFDLEDGVPDEINSSIIKLIMER